LEADHQFSLIRWKLVAAIAGVAAFAVVGYFMTRIESDPEGQFIGWMTIVVFGTVGVLFIPGNILILLISRPTIRISPAGIEDRRLGVGCIPWEAIESAAIHSDRAFPRARVPSNYRQYLYLKLKDEEYWTSRMPLRCRIWHPR
jgi:hypothetical protein